MVGTSSDSTIAQSTTITEFIDPTINIYLIIGLVVVIGMSLYFKYGRRKRPPAIAQGEMNS